MNMATNPHRRDIVLKRLDEVSPAPRNPKEHDLDSLKASIVRFGFADAVVLDERTDRLVSGHGRVEALKLLKSEGAAAPDGVMVRDGHWHVPVQTGWASKDDTEAEAFLIAANRLVERGAWDEAGLEEVLRDLAKSGARALDGVGYDKAFVDELLRSVQPGEFPALPFGERGSLQQMTFTLSLEQAGVVRAAMDAAGDSSDGTNENRNGNALANACRGFLASRSP